MSSESTASTSALLLSVAPRKAGCTGSCQHSEVRKKQDPRAVPQKVRMLDACSNSFPPLGETRNWGFSPACSTLNRETLLSELCVSSHHCLCSQWHAIRTFYCQNLDSGKKECSPLGRYTPPLHQTSEPCTCVSAFSFSPRRDAGSGSFH